MTLKQVVDELFDQIAGPADSAPQLSSRERGVVSRVLRGVVEVEGFSQALSDELISFEGGGLGLAMDLEPGRAGIVLLSDPIRLRPGHVAWRSQRAASVPTGDGLLGRTITPLGQPLDELGPVVADRYDPVEQPAPAIIERAPVSRPLQTGNKAVDALVPIGRGQRELIVGDRQTGKTAVAIDTILNQAGTGVISVYCAIGQRGDAVARVIARLRDADVLKSCVIVVAGAEEPAGLQYVAPYAAMTVAERFMRAGRDVLIVFDDLTRHARAYRELSLLLRRPPGREAYPGDIFYIHSRLLERATQLRASAGGGSLTALPVVETQAQNLSAYIPTNLISITDGQIFLETDLFFSGIRPAVNVGLSVSRVGSSAQTKAMKQVAGKIKGELAQYREMAAFAQFGSDLDAATQKLLARGARLTELLKQPQFSPLKMEEQVVVIFSGTRGYLDALPVAAVGKFEESLLTALRDEGSILSSIASAKAVSDETEKKLVEFLDKFAKSFVA